jgi:hypothetical protein
MEKARFIILCLLGLFSILIHAHNPNEVQYDFKLDADHSTLEIHLTPMTLVALVQHLYPELKDEKLIKLEDYVEGFEVYFNSTIAFKTGNGAFKYELMSYNLYDHDAWLKFKVKAVSKAVSTFDLTLTSFTTVYKRISNIVTVSSKQIDIKFILNGNQKYYKYKKNHDSATKGDVLHVSLWLGLSTFFGFLIFRLKKP